MKQSQLFTKTLKNISSEEKSCNAQLLMRAGFIDKLAAGVYTYLPLGFRVMKKIENIIREEMNAVGGQEMLMPALQPKANWLATGRWDGLDVLFKLQGADEKEYALGATHEEVITPLFAKFIASYKDLPVAAYQIQTKFRNEKRAKSGVLRGRQFLMKDMYSFHADEKDLDSYYEKVADAYWKIFSRVGIKDKTYFTLASGGTFSKYSHEFQTITDAGEDTIFICNKCSLAINKEIKEITLVCPKCGGSEFDIRKAIEVGNIFKLKTKYSEPFDLKFKNAGGSDQIVIMGCYGMGIDRLIGTVVEVCNDKNGIIWPMSIAPFQAHLILLNPDDSVSSAEANSIYASLQKAGIEVLFDDRILSAGVKLKDSDLIGIPYRLIIGGKNKGKIEIKMRSKSGADIVDAKEAIKMISGG